MKKTGGIFHDRFIVLDYGTADERVFLCGASSKDAGQADVWSRHGRELQ